jgi:type IV pilus biogenesis protein CpaD/CtpE
VSKAHGALALLAIICLAGCTSFDPMPHPTTEDATKDTTMTPAESRQEIDVLIAATTAAVGGEWETTYLAYEDCSLPDGSAGVLIPIEAAVTTSVEDPQAMVETVRQLLASEYGFDDAFLTETKLKTVMLYEVTVPKRDDGFGFRFGASVNAMTIDSVSACTSGSADELNRDRD